MSEPITMPEIAPVVIPPVFVASEGAVGAPVAGLCVGARVIGDTDDGAVVGMLVIFLILLSAWSVSRMYREKVSAKGSATTL